MTAGGLEEVLRKLLMALALAAPATDPAAPIARANPLFAADAIDHVLLWTPNIDRLTSSFAVKMGFQVRPGGTFPDGVANRLIRFADNSYLELLHFTRPERELTGEALQEYRFTSRTGGGANSFALAIDDVDLTRSFLSRNGLPLSEADPFSYDSDGDGPRPSTVMWYTVNFAKPPITSSNLFFIKYNLPAPSKEGAADEIAFSRHPNGALGVSAIWLLSADVASDRRKLEQLGFKAGAPVHLPHIRATGTRFNLGDEAVLLLKPDGPGPAAKAVSARGGHIFGVSIAVADLGRAQRIVQRGYGKPLERYRGPMGEAISAPSHDDVGLTMELHQAIPK